MTNQTAKMSKSFDHIKISSRNYRYTD